MGLGLRVSHGDFMTPNFGSKPDVDGGDDLGDLGAVCDLGDPVHLSLE